MGQDLTGRVRVVRRREAEEGFSATDHVRYPLPVGSTMSYVVEGRVGPDRAPMHAHEQEEYWFIIEGSGRALFGNEEVGLSAGDLIIIPAGLPHTVWSDGGMRELAFMVETGKPDARAAEVEAKRVRGPAA